MTPADPRAALQAHLDGLERGTFLLPRCNRCGEWWHPLDGGCGACGDAAFEMLEATGLGRVFSFIAMRKPEIAAAPSPIAALVDLEEGVRVVTNLVDVDFAEVDFDMRVRLDLWETDSGRLVPVFRPEG